MSGPMVRAILDGRKSQTRRLVKFPPAPMKLGTWEPTTFGGPGTFLDKACTRPDDKPARTAMWHTRTGAAIACPCGVPGDRLWVRETWSLKDHGNAAYRADGEREFYKWHPSIFMPRWACRLVLEVTAVRVERLQEISEADAKAEGCKADGPGLFQFYFDGQESKSDTERTAYRHLWDSLNAKRAPWASNPWVWVVEFRTTSPAASAEG